MSSYFVLHESYKSYLYLTLLCLTHRGQAFGKIRIHFLLLRFLLYFAKVRRALNDKYFGFNRHGVYICKHCTSNSFKNAKKKSSATFEKRQSITIYSLQSIRPTQGDPSVTTPAYTGIEEASKRDDRLSSCRQRHLRLYALSDARDSLKNAAGLFSLVWIFHSSHLLYIAADGVSERKSKVWEEMLPNIRSLFLVFWRPVLYIYSAVVECRWGDRLLYLRRLFKLGWLMFVIRRLETKMYSAKKVAFKAFFFSQACYKTEYN